MLGREERIGEFITSSFLALSLDPPIGPDQLRSVLPSQPRRAPRIVTRSSAWAVSRYAVMELSTSPLMDSRVCSSTMEQILIGRPFP